MRILPRHLRAFLARVVLPVGIAALLGAFLVAGPAQASYMIPGSPWRAKDFALFKKDGVYHLFYIRNNATLPLSQTENDLGHAVSTDLYHWTQRPAVLPVRPGEWDNFHVWAPSIVESDGLFWMFYTGVTLAPGFNATQRTGLAVSEDLESWRQLDAPILTSADIPWAWWQPTSALPAFRDPAVIPNPNAPGEWLMYYTATLPSDTAGTLVGVAQSSGDLNTWSDLKPLWITHSSFTFNVLTESPHVFQHDGLWYLFITTNSGQPLSFYTSNDPTADPAGWTYRGRLRNMLGYDTSFWFASEYLRDGTHDYFAFVSGDRIEVREILWTGPWQFALVQPPLMHIQNMRWEQTIAKERDTVDVRIVASNPFSGIGTFEVLARDAGGPITVYPVDSLGITEGVPLFGDTTFARIPVKRLPSRSDTTTYAFLKLRTTDQTAETAWLAVGPPPRDTTTPPPPDTTLDEAPPLPDLTDRPRRGTGILAYTKSPAGSGPAVMLRLEHESHARVDLFDLQGRKLVTLADRRLPSGPNVLPWDGRDANGVRLRDGVYFARAQVGGEVFGTRVLLMRR